MKFIELKEKVQSGENISNLITLSYVSLVSKKNMVDNIVKICLNRDENNFLKIDYIIKNLFESLYILVNYTNIEFEGLYDAENNIDSVLAIEFYDFCKQNKIIDYVLKNSECNEFITLLENEISQEIELNNSVASILSKTLNSISLKLPAQGELGSIMKELPNILSSLKQPKATPRKKKVV